MITVCYLVAEKEFNYFERAKFGSIAEKFKENILNWK